MLALLLLYAVPFVETTVLALLFTPITIWLAPRIGYLDHPGHRKVHSHPKPVLGGLAIFAAFQVAVLGNLWLGGLVAQLPVGPGHWLSDFIEEVQKYHSGLPFIRSQLSGFIVAGWMVFILGLVDDKRGMNPLLKLGGQCLAGAILFYFGIRIDFLYEISPAISCVTTMLWVAMVANAFNWIDNMDGLCAGIAAIACLFFAMVAHQVEAQVFMVLIFLALCGACFGFLFFNSSPSKTFMGDSGSMFIGYNVAALSVLASYTTSKGGGLAFFIPVVILSIPLFDMFTVIAIRLKRGKPIYLGDKNHISHRLVDLGLTHRQAVAMIYLFCICTGMGALLLHRVTTTLRVIALIQVGVFFLIILLLERVPPRMRNGAAGP